LRAKSVLDQAIGFSVGPQAAVIPGFATQLGDLSELRVVECAENRVAHAEPRASQGPGQRGGVQGSAINAG
jgi:hypothetical protein